MDQQESSRKKDISSLKKVRKVAITFQYFFQLIFMLMGWLFINSKSEELTIALIILMTVTFLFSALFFYLSTTLKEDIEMLESNNKD